jgi:hypothetical protein
MVTLPLSHSTAVAEMKGEVVATLGPTAHLTIAETASRFEVVDFNLPVGN